MLELILIVLLILWLLGGIALPDSGSLLNIILVFVLVYVVLKIFKRV